LASTESVIGEDSALAGKVAGQDVTILGRFEGDLDVKGRLRIGPRAAVKATARAQVVEVNGEFDGEIRAARIVFGTQAHARGTFRSDRLSMEDGAWVEGSFNPQAPAPAATAAAQKPAAAAASAAPAQPPASAAPAQPAAGAGAPVAKPTAPIPPPSPAPQAATGTPAAAAAAESKDARPKPETGTAPV
jgi:cytoskeletal protein CcmA (bactofilin family)